MAPRRIKHWGWGYEDDPDTPAHLITGLEEYFADFFGIDGFNTLPVPAIDDIKIGKPRVAIPDRLKSILSDSHEDRVRHTLGRSVLDYVHIFEKKYDNPPDVVAYVKNDNDVIEVMDWAVGANVAVIPFGGGTSVSGGIEPRVGGNYSGVVSVDTTMMGEVLEIDDVSRSARIQAGAFGPNLEAQLKPHGYSLRHFPQSFEHSTLGGWIATRSGGHFATIDTHIDDFVENIKMVTPTGVIETRRMPGEGAGPDPDRFIMGTEGALGLITVAWVRLQTRNKFRGSIAVFFDDFLEGSEAVRQICQSGLYPANVRIIDNEEARVNRVSDKDKSILFLGFESHDHPVDAWIERALEICGDHGGSFDLEVLKDPNSHRKAEQGRWRDIFLETSYYREITTPREIIYGTTETSITWDKFPDCYRAATKAVSEAMIEATGKPGSVSCRFTHLYPDGCAPYWSWYCLGRHGEMIDQWTHVKSAITNVFMEHGGSTTHHTSIGRDHMPYLKMQTDPMFEGVLQAAKDTWDPNWIMNPGVIIPERQ